MNRGWINGYEQKLSLYSLQYITSLTVSTIGFRSPIVRRGPIEHSFYLYGWNLIIVSQLFRNGIHSQIELEKPQILKTSLSSNGLRGCYQGFPFHYLWAMQKAIFSRVMKLFTSTNLDEYWKIWMKNVHSSKSMYIHL